MKYNLNSNDLFLWLIAWTLAATHLTAQEETLPQPTLQSPYGTMWTHLYFLQYDSYDPELAAMTMHPGIDSAQAVRLAIQLKQLYDGKGLYVRLNMIPQIPEYMDSTARAHIYTPFPIQLPDIYLERIDDSWYYARDAMAKVPAMHRSMYPLGADLISRSMPPVLQQRFFGVALWQFLGFLVLLSSCAIIYLILSRLLRPPIRWIAALTQSWGYARPRDLIQTSTYISMLIAVITAEKMLPVLQLQIRLSQFFNVLLGIASIILIVLITWVGVRVMTHRLRLYTEKTETKMDEQLMPIVRNLLQILVVVIGIIYILRLLEVNVTALIAGVSIGALAIALAAQDTVKNLIGSVMIFLDKPFQVGDYIIADGVEGTIREVGFRSTRIQTIDTSIVAVPNGNIANTSITNRGVRTFRIMNITLGITYDTSPEKIRSFIAALKQLIEEHPQIVKENYFVHFREMGDFALKIMFRCLLSVNNFADELVIKEGLYLRFMEIAAELGIEYAFPTTTVHLERDE